MCIGAAGLALAVFAGAACKDADGIPESCGDALLDPGELCDDGDDDPANGCDRACQPVPDEAWRYDWTDQDSQFFLNSIATTAEGRVYLAGDRGYGVVIVALSADGDPLWRKTVDNMGSHALAATADGGCLLQGMNLVRLDADGEVVWTAEGAGHPGGMVVDGDAIHVLYTENTGPLSSVFRVRSVQEHDGSLRWDQPIGVPETGSSGVDLARTGLSLVVLGSDNEGQFLVAVDPVSGATQPRRMLSGARVEDIRGYDGDLLGLQPRSDPPGEPAAVQRLRLDGTVVWTHAFPDASVDILDIEVGPTGSIVATGAVPFGDPRAVLLSMDPNGAIVWTIEHIPEAPSTATYLITAFGPGFLAVAGLDYTYTMENYTLDRLWVQRRGG